MPYLYLSYKKYIKISHIITSTSKKYEHAYTNIFLQLGLIHYCKLESPGVCGIALGCPGCRSSNHTWAMVGIEKSNIYQDFKILYGLIHNFFWEGVAVKIWSLGLIIVCLSLVLWCTLCECLVTSTCGCWVHNWYYTWYICAVFYGSGVIFMHFLWIKCYYIHVL